MDKIEKYRYDKENTHFDRKEARIENKKIIAHVNGFANAEGGKLVLGISDSGNITGCKAYEGKRAEEIKRLINNSITPTIDFEVHEIDIEDDYIIEIDVQPKTDSVVSIRDSGEVYLRQSDKTDKLKHDRILALQYDKGQRSYEDEINQRFDTDDFNTDLFDKYREVMNSDISNEDILNNRTGSNKKGYTNSAILMFAKNPEKYIPNSRVRFIRYEGTTQETGSRLNIVKEKNFEYPLPILIDEVRKLVQSQLRDFNSLDKNGKFISVPEYPEFAWLEEIVNAVVHRDYSITGDCVKILMFDDRLEILSPGKLPSMVNLENLKYTRFSRNPRIARLMADFGYVKELNEGVKRIYDEMQDYFLKEPEYSEPANKSVKLKLENNIGTRRTRKNDKISDYITEEVMDSLSDDEIKIIQYLYPSNKINIKKANSVMGKKDAYSRKILGGLVKKGLLIWNGSSKQDPTQYYSLKE
ncbi:ATP-dependent DNA helicase RecG [Staphylococcus chromogenes]|uniref:ATP-binding protein n=1 Tax=Staphylococcus chromogenes TaxID=46126 RepID=UPI000D1BF452|nr:ATP-binding protein [Staphylococcus chromogenes]PTF95293.1 ATP-dependent DNA helicase RecG [Staphylococcus chromogenes]RIL98927.1 ATP-dependent DNA helicase RecG [Staphylococcus chromogenes]